MASKHDQVRISVNDLDPDPFLICCKNGAVDLRTGELRAPEPSAMMTRQVTVDYDPTAKCPQWLKFLERVQPDPEQRAFLQRSIGYTLTGHTREEVMFLTHGLGQNGKTKVIETLYALMGGYAQKAPADLLLARGSGSDQSNDVARLRGARFVAAVETDDNRRLAEARVKTVRRHAWAQGGLGASRHGKTPGLASYAPRVGAGLRRILIAVRGTPRQYISSADLGQERSMMRRLFLDEAGDFNFKAPLPNQAAGSRLFILTSVAVPSDSTLGGELNDLRHRLALADDHLQDRVFHATKSFARGGPRPSGRG